LNRHTPVEESITMIEPNSMLPSDAARATLVGRVWLPGSQGGPTPVLVRDGGVFDLAHIAITLSELLEMPDPVAAARSVTGPALGCLQTIQANGHDPQHLHLLAPCDLQPVKAAGVTFVASMLERVIEERARGDALQAQEIRRAVVALIGDDLSRVRPGSEQAAKLKALLIERGIWSQYLEVGIGPYAEIFTKAPPLSAVGPGAQIGLHPQSSWNNPEPEVVLAVSSQGRIVGSTLGNDVNLRDFEGRSALLLGKAKDNNGSCAIGPFVRLFDQNFSLDDVRCAELRLDVEGADGYRLSGSSSMRLISRDPLELVAQAMGGTHQYPDGLMLFCGTMFAPTQDRDVAGSGFTHKLGDIVTIQSEKLGCLVNRVGRSDQIPAWDFGLGALMRSLGRRGLL
jgi:fumarylacetoacetate (FAA) hydrolase family protein